jgi:hypothetical protein
MGRNIRMVRIKRTAKTRILGKIYTLGGVLLSAALSCPGLVKTNTRHPYNKQNHNTNRYKKPFNYSRPVKVQPLRKSGNAPFFLYSLVLPLLGGEEPAYAGEVLPDWYNTLNVSRAILGILARGGLSLFLTQALAWLSDPYAPRQGIFLPPIYLVQIGVYV